MAENAARSALYAWARQQRNDVTAFTPARDGIHVVFDWTAHRRLAQGTPEQCCAYLGISYEGAPVSRSHTADW